MGHRERGRGGRDGGRDGVGIPTYGCSIHASGTHLPPKRHRVPPERRQRPRAVLLRLQQTALLQEAPLVHRTLPSGRVVEVTVIVAHVGLAVVARIVVVVVVVQQLRLPGLWRAGAQADGRGRRAGNDTRTAPLLVANMAGPRMAGPRPDLSCNVTVMEFSAKLCMRRTRPAWARIARHMWGPWGGRGEEGVVCAPVQLIP